MYLKFRHDGRDVSLRCTQRQYESVLRRFTVQGAQDRIPCPFCASGCEHCPLAKALHWKSWGCGDPCMDVPIIRQAVRAFQNFGCSKWSGPARQRRVLRNFCRRIRAAAARGARKGATAEV